MGPAILASPGSLQIAEPCARLFRRQPLGYRRLDLAVVATALALRRPHRQRGLGCRYGRRSRRADRERSLVVGQTGHRIRWARWETRRCRNAELRRPRKTFRTWRWETRESGFDFMMCGRQKRGGWSPLAFRIGVARRVRDALSAESANQRSPNPLRRRMRISLCDALQGL
jgi:hypothetical protein